MTTSLQTIILQLQDFWAQKGCLITQPYYTQVGAGTMSPAAFLMSVLGNAVERVFVPPSFLKNEWHPTSRMRVVVAPELSNCSSIVPRKQFDF